MVAQISVHDDNKLADRVLQAVDIRRSETEFLFSRTEHDFTWAVDVLKLLRNFQGSIWRSVI